MRSLTRALALLLCLLPPAAAQFGSTPESPLSVSTATVPQITLGTPIPFETGPWVLGEVLFLSKGKLVSDYAWRDRVRGRRGLLYARADILSDVDSLLALGKFDTVSPSLFEIPSAPVPPEFTTIAASTSQVRLVFNIAEKPVVVSTAATKKEFPPAAISGVVLTPTAYRGTGRFTTPGMGLDINAMYVIGRLYGKNSFANSPRKTNYIDRIGLWMLTADGKMQVQSETALRPAVAVGGQGAFMIRDSGQPKIDAPTTISVNARQKNARVLSDGYFVVSKKIGPVRSSAGIMQGNMGDAVAQFSEFLSPDALTFYAGRRGQEVHSRTVPFASFLLLPKPSTPLAIEIMKFNGAALNPILINFKIGYFLKLNFDIALLKYQGGYDVLGVIQFRYNQFPRR